jgi:hypothetical protein
LFLYVLYTETNQPKPDVSSEPSPATTDTARNNVNIAEAGASYGNHARHTAAISPQFKVTAQNFPNIDSRQFSLNDLKRITNDFNNTIGIGGFGRVFLGMLEDGYQVAVKMISHTSAQGTKEFLAEVII